MKRILVFFFLLATLAAPAFASASPALFENYAYGMAKGEVEKVPGMEHGEGETEGELLLRDVRWLDRQWTAKFVFDDNQLVEISLIGAYTRETFSAVRSQMAQEGNEILGIVLDEKALDLFSLISAGGVDAFRERFLELLRAKVPARLSYQYFCLKDVSPEVWQRATNITQFLGMVDRNIKETEVALLGDGEKSGPQVIVVSFTYPVLDVFRNPPEELRSKL